MSSRNRFYHNNIKKANHKRRVNFQMQTEKWDNGNLCLDDVIQKGDPELCLYFYTLIGSDPSVDTSTLEEIMKQQGSDEVLTAYARLKRKFTHEEEMEQ